MRFTRLPPASSTGGGWMRMMDASQYPPPKIRPVARPSCQHYWQSRAAALVAIQRLL